VYSPWIESLRAATPRLALKPSENTLREIPTITLSRSFRQVNLR